MTLSPQDRQALAIAFVTGQASTKQEKQFRELFAEDSTFRKEVRDLELWLAPLHSDSVDVEPPENLLNTIMADIDALETDKLAPTKEVSTGSSATITHPIDVFEANVANDNTLSFWRGLAVASSIIAALAIGSHFVDISGSQKDPILVANNDTANSPLLAVLQDQSKPELVAIIYNPQTRKIVARLNNVSLPQQGDFELWLIRDGASGPVSLGVLKSDDEAAELSLEIQQGLESQNDILAISLESVGGSDTGQPQGPILYTGTVTKI